jgi:hypothetical protein
MTAKKGTGTSGQERETVANSEQYGLLARGKARRSGRAFSIAREDGSIGVAAIGPQLRPQYGHWELCAASLAAELQCSTLHAWGYASPCGHHISHARNRFEVMLKHRNLALRETP